MTYIYLDVLIILNIYVNYFLIKATARFTHTSISAKRCIFASVIGSLFSLTILLPELHFALNLLIKLIAAAVITASAFGLSDKFQFLKLLLYFFGMNFIFAGIMMALYLLFSPSFMCYNNSFIYIDFSLLTLIICTIIAYALISLIRFIMDKSKIDNDDYLIIIKRNNKIISVDALADTGNSLFDSFTGKSVIICSRKCAYDLFDSHISFSVSDYLADNTSLPKGFRFIPYSTISESGIIPIFKPDEVIIKNKNTKKIKKVDALIGINPLDTNAIFNPKLLSM